MAMSKRRHARGPALPQSCSPSGEPGALPCLEQCMQPNNHPMHVWPHCRKGQLQYVDEEAALSEEEGQGHSSDEDDGEGEDAQLVRTVACPPPALTAPRPAPCGCCLHSLHLLPCPARHGCCPVPRPTSAALPHAPAALPQMLTARGRCLGFRVPAVFQPWGPWLICQQRCAHGCEPPTHPAVLASSLGVPAPHPATLPVAAAGPHRHCPGGRAR
jgi:hypothetical protein